MVAFNFKARFAPLVASWAKKQTVRAKRRAKTGDRLQLFTGLRTSDCRKLIEPDPICTLVDYVSIRPQYLTFGNKDLQPGDADHFARRDGFANYAEMVAWFEETYGSPYFVGYVHVWAPAALNIQQRASE